MGQVLYRKYRSRNLDEIVGQEHITTTLKNALKSGAISHAYLFTGPRGTGKTSIARILAHQLNELDYSSEDTHLDIIEIDAASNRGIDEIRDLREKVSTAPSSGKFKVYIIDEVHMLTTPAFNALLKTLEEPPAHVVFILATTEAHKLPETITSRTQRYTFRPVEHDKVVAHLRHIAQQEKISIDDEALSLIADHGEGSFRDSISLLDQSAGHGETVTVETVRDVLGVPPESAVQDLLSSVSQGDIAEVTTQLQKLLMHGYQAAAIAKQLAALCRTRLFSKEPAGLEQQGLLNLMAKLIDVPVSPSPERLLEIVLLQSTVPTTTKAVQASTAAAPSQVSQPVKRTDPAPKTPKPTKAVSKPLQTSEPKNPSTKSDPTKVSDVPVAFTGDIVAIWPQVLDAMKQQYNTVYGILRMAEPQIIDGKLILEFQYAFHQKRIQELKQRQIISTVIEQLTGDGVEIECRHNRDASPSTAGATETGEPVIATVSVQSTEPEASNDSLKTVSNIFGGGELLES